MSVIQILNINSYTLSNLQLIPPLSFLHLDFDRHVLLTLFIYECPQFILFLVWYDNWGLQKLNNVDSNNDIHIWKKFTILKIESNVDIHRKIMLTKHVDQCPHEGKKAAE